MLLKSQVNVPYIFLAYTSLIGLEYENQNMVHANYERSL